MLLKTQSHQKLKQLLLKFILNIFVGIWSSVLV